MNEKYWVGSVPTEYYDLLNGYVGLPIYQSTGLAKHIASRHPGCEQYVNTIPFIIQNPDYIGISPREKHVSFELVKVMDDNVQIGIKLDLSGRYYYVATLYTITDAKLKHRLASGRLKPLDQV